MSYVSRRANPYRAANPRLVTLLIATLASIGGLVSASAIADDTAPVTANAADASLAANPAIETSAAADAEQIPASALAGMPPEVVRALLAINLDKEQRGLFGEQMRNYSADVQNTIARVTRGRNPDKARTIKRKTRSLTKALDKKMKAILREDQWSAYENYKALIMRSAR